MPETQAAGDASTRVMRVIVFPSTAGFPSLGSSCRETHAGRITVAFPGGYLLSRYAYGGHLFCLHIVAALGLGGAEVNPLCFQPFAGYSDDTIIAEGIATPPQIPGIGFEARQGLRDQLATLLDG
jgi:hypothetical protein